MNAPEPLYQKCEVGVWQILTDQGYYTTAVAFVYDLFAALDKEVDSSDERWAHCVEQLMEIIGDVDGGHLARWQEARGDKDLFRQWVCEHVEQTIAVATAKRVESESAE